VPKKHCHVRLAPDFANLSVLEEFVFSCPFLEGGERNRAVLLATEYFDNIVAHSRSISTGDVSVAVDKSARTSIVLRYRTCNFSEMVRANRTTKPHFDLASGRYRGLGLLMCRNLASSIHYKKGLLKSSVIIIL
jgi:hypothetical protein